MMRHAFSRSGRLKRIEHAFLFVARALIVAYLVFSVADWLSKRELWRISAIDITGAHAVDAAELRNLIEKEIDGNWYKWWMRKDNPVLYPRSVIDRKIREHSGWIKDVSLLADGKQLHVQITEYVPEYIWCSDPTYATSSIPADTCWYGDERGEIFTKTPAYSGYPFPRIISSDQGESDVRGKAYMFSQTEFERLSTFVEHLNEHDIVVKAIEHISEHDYVFLVNRPWSIFWESDTDPELSVSHLIVALESIEDESTVRELDLRFGDKIFVR